MKIFFMDFQVGIFLLSASLVSALSFGQHNNADATRAWDPVPKIITPGKSNSDAPSDAIILFDRKNLSEWVSADDTMSPAGWIVEKKVIVVKTGSGNIQTRRLFTDFQLHIEWLTPKNVIGSGQSRGNSGVFLASTGPGDDGYEIQVLDCYNNTTYTNGQTASIYKQYIPLVNACKKPGEWQSYDIIWTAPRFNDDGTLNKPARITALHNGVLVQNNVELKGPTVHNGSPVYKKHGPSAIKLQDHGDPGPPLNFRNIWVREL